MAGGVSCLVGGFEIDYSQQVLYLTLSLIMRKLKNLTRNYNWHVSLALMLAFVVQSSSSDSWDQDWHFNWNIALKHMLLFKDTL